MVLHFFRSDFWFRMNETARCSFGLQNNRIAIETMISGEPFAKLLGVYKSVNAVPH